MTILTAEEARHISDTALEMKYKADLVSIMKSIDVATGLGVYHIIKDGAMSKSLSKTLSDNGYKIIWDQKNDSYQISWHDNVTK